MSSRRPPPCLTVRIPGKPSHVRNASAPAFGISTYSHRIRPARVRQHSSPEGAEGRSSTESTASAEMEAAAVALAQVGNRAPSRLVVHGPSRAASRCSSAQSTHTIPISVDVQPPTPDPASLPVSASTSPSIRRRTRSAEEVNIRAVKQSRRIASIYSVTSSTGMGPTSEPDSFYLRPDLSGASGLSLDQLPHTVSLEDLTLPSHAHAIHEASKPAASVAASAGHSRTTSSASSTYSTASPTSPTAPASLADSHLPLSTHAVPPAQSSLPDYASSAHAYSRGLAAAPAAADSRPSTRFREVLNSGPGGPRETEADKLKRLYLCPWEGASEPRGEANAPRRSGTLRARLAAVGVGATFSAQDDLEKGEYSEKAQGGAVSAQTSRAEQRRKRLLINLGLVLLLAAVFADLIALNVRVFAGRDAYLSE